MADAENVLEDATTSSRVETLHDVVAVCPVCGHGHSSDLDRFEHWLLESGGLRRVTDLGWKGVPLTRPRIWIPGTPPGSPRSRERCVESGGFSATWATLSADQVAAG